MSSNAQPETPPSPTPAPARTHLAPSRGQTKSNRSVVPESKLVAGRFGRMFRNLPSFEPSDEIVRKCVRLMREADDAKADNPKIPAGFTYLGQFIDHDLTFDPVSSLQRQNDPDGLRNFRTPNFDLDSVYGLGRSDQPYLYQRDDPAKLLVGKGEGDGEDDLPRNGDETALIGDPRNDENILVGQLHLAFLKLHNQIVDDIRTEGQAGRPALGPHLWPTGDISDADYVFHEAQRLTRWHYQWIVLHEFLPKICGTDLITELVEETDIPGVGTKRQVRNLEYYKPEESPFIPVEWSVAAYRYGHSQVRASYNLNSFLTKRNPDIAVFIENPDAQPLKHLGGGRLLPEFWTLDWRFFFKQNLPNTSADQQVTPQPSRRIDGKLASGLKVLPNTPKGISASLAERNLQRGRTMGLPSGQAVARRMCVKPLTAKQLGLTGEAPLWFYILKEAEMLNDGSHLGPVGGRIVAEVMLGILKADPFSFLRTEPTWEPVLPAAIAPSRAAFGIADLLAYAVPNDGRRFG